VIIDSQSIKKWLSNSVTKNFFSLGILQASSLAISIVTAPFVIRAVGISNFGSINVALSVITMLNVVIDYGFNLSATREISLNRWSTENLSFIASKVLLSKFLLLVFSLILLGLWVAVVQSSFNEWKLFLFSTPILIANCLLPTWYFQGLEKIHLMTRLSLVSKLFLLISIILLVRKNDDYVFVNLYTGVTNCFVSGVALWIMFKKHNISLTFVSKRVIFQELKNGSLILLSNLANILYTVSNVIILNFVTNDKFLVGQYSIAERIVAIAKQILGVYSQVIYPRLCVIGGKGFSYILGFFKKNFIPFILAMLLISILTFLFSSFIVQFFAGERNNATILLLQILSLAPFVIALNIPSYQILLVYNLKKSYSTILIAGAFISIISNIIMSTYWAAKGTVFSVLLTETFIATGLFVMVLINKRSLNTR
jgi:PST family polysaccharide transporter